MTGTARSHQALAIALAVAALIALAILAEYALGPGGWVFALGFAFASLCGDALSPWSRRKRPDTPSEVTAQR